MVRQVLLIASLIAAVAVTGAAIDKFLESLKRHQKLAYFADEARIDELVSQLSEKYRAQSFAIRNVKLISMTEGRAIPHQTVIVEQGRILQVGPSSSIRCLPGCE